MGRDPHFASIAESKSLAADMEESKGSYTKSVHVSDHLPSESIKEVANAVGVILYTVGEASNTSVDDLVFDLFQ